MIYFENPTSVENYWSGKMNQKMLYWLLVVCMMVKFKKRFTLIKLK